MNAITMNGMTAFSLAGSAPLNNAEELEAALRHIGATRYHNLHPFHRMLHGGKLNKGQEAAVVESVKAASDVYAPAGGEVVEGNAAVADDPALINRDPEGEGWFFKLKLDDPSATEGLMDEASYRDWVKTL